MIRRLTRRSLRAGRSGFTLWSGRALRLNWPQSGTHFRFPFDLAFMASHSATACSTQFFLGGLGSDREEAMVGYFCSRSLSNCSSPADCEDEDFLLRLLREREPPDEDSLSPPPSPDLASRT